MSRQDGQIESEQADKQQAAAASGSATQSWRQKEED